MTLEQRVEKLEKQLNSLHSAFLQAQRNQVPITAKTDDSANKIVDLTPYTETKIGYYGETEKTFYNVPQGNVTVFFDNYNGDYVATRNANNLTVTFFMLTEQTNITISIS